MHAKKAGLMSVILWLTGCATPPPAPQVQVQREVEVPEQVEDQKQEQTLTTTQMLADLERVTAMDAGKAKQMIEQLQIESSSLTAGDRFELVLLLSQKGSSYKSQKQAWQLLDGLDTETSDPGVKEILSLQRRILSLERLYRLERNKTVELQKKIEYLKGLERELDESNQRIEEPLNPKPEPVQ
jgi:hypothetical protein